MWGPCIIQAGSVLFWTLAKDSAPPLALLFNTRNRPSCITGVAATWRNGFLIVPFVRTQITRSWL